MRSPSTSTRRLEKPSTRPSSRSLRSASPGRGCTDRAICISEFRLQTSDQIESCQNPRRAAARLSTTASAARSGGVRASHAAPAPVRTRIPRAPTARPSRTSSHVSPTTNERAGSRPRSRSRAVDHAAPRLAAVAGARELGRPARPDGAGNSNTRRRGRRRPPAAHRCARCVSWTNASLKKPRAIPDWLVTTTTAKPARLSRADRVDGPRIVVRRGRARRDSRRLRSSCRRGRGRRPRACATSLVERHF